MKRLFLKQQYSVSRNELADFMLSWCGLRSLAIRIETMVSFNLLPYMAGARARPVRHLQAFVRVVGARIDRNVGNR